MNQKVEVPAALAVGVRSIGPSRSASSVGLVVVAVDERRSAIDCIARLASSVPSACVTLCRRDAPSACRIGNARAT